MEKVAEVSRLIRPFVIEAGSKLERSHDKIVQLWYIQSFSIPQELRRGEIEGVSHERQNFHDQ